MEILVKNAALARFCAEVADEFRALLPDVYADMLEAIREDSKQLLKPSGMSAGGHFMSYAKIHPYLYAFVRHEYRKRFEDVDFWSDEARVRFLFNCWSDLQMKRKPSSFLQVSRP